MSTWNPHGYRRPQYFSLSQGLPGGQSNNSLDDSSAIGTGDRELLIVEGESAAQSVLAARNESNQAILAMQGKPLNAKKASLANVKKYELYQLLADCINGCIGESYDLGDCPFERILLLFDPDADGIHCGALLLLFFDRFFPQLITDKRLHVIRAPSCRIHFEDEQGNARSELAFSPEEAIEQERKLKADAALTSIKRHHYRGLASIELDVLFQTCISPGTRISHLLTSADAQSANRYFGKG